MATKACVSRKEIVTTECMKASSLKSVSFIPFSLASSSIGSNSRAEQKFRNSTKISRT